MVTIHANLSEISVFFSILLRVSLVLFLLPVFSGSQVPTMVKAGASMALALLFYSFLHRSVDPLPLQPGPLVLAVAGELIFGMILSLSMLLVFAAFQSAGELISFEMGLSFAQIADPQSGTQVMVFSRWFQLVAVLLLFSLNGHHIILSAIVESFRTVPIGGFTLNSATYGKMIALSGYLFVIAVKIAAPVMVVLMLMNVGLGLVAKFSPQINILMTSFPLTIFLGLLFMGFSVSVWGNAMERFLEKLMFFLRGFTG